MRVHLETLLRTLLERDLCTRQEVRDADKSLYNERGNPLAVVVSGLSSDAHTWNLVYLQLLLTELG